MDYPSTSREHEAPQAEPHQREGLPAVLWRYKFLLILATAAGIGGGYWYGQRQPISYRASTRLMVKSDRPLQFDAVTGQAISGVPSASLVSTIIQSDEVTEQAASLAALQSVPTLAGRDPASLQGMLRNGIRFNAEGDSRKAQSLVATLSFDGNSPEVCVAAVNAMTDALQQYFSREQEANVTKIAKLISEAQDKLLPQLTDLEQRYREFRSESPLEWGAEGEVVNPYRERQIVLQTRKQEAEEKLMQLRQQYRLVQRTHDRDPNPSLLLQMIARFGEDYNPNPAPNQPESTNRVPDEQLSKLAIEQKIVPLLIQREELRSQVAEEHPAAKSLDEKIEIMREKMVDLAKREAERMAELQDNGDRSEEEKARLTKQLRSAIVSMRDEQALLEELIKELDESLNRAKADAEKLVQFENDDAMYRRQIDRVNGMLVQLENQLAGLNVADISESIHVETLQAANSAYVTGPNVQQFLFMGGFLGFAIASGLGFLLESQAKIFRSSEEIARDLQLPILSHVPLDESKRGRKKKSDSEDPWDQLDPRLFVVREPGSPSAEAIRGVRTSVYLSNRHEETKVLQITSPLPGDGKSTLAANLACSIAASGKRVVLVDADLRKPRLHERFNLQEGPGLTGLINGVCDPPQAIQTTVVPGLEVLPCGEIPTNPAEALSLPEFVDIIAFLRDRYDYVIIDSPPLLMVTDPVMISTHVDAVILALRIRRGVRPSAREATGILRSAGAKILGIIVNAIDEVADTGFYRAGSSASYQSSRYGYNNQSVSYLKGKDEDGYVVVGKRDKLEPPTVSKVEESVGS